MAEYSGDFKTPPGRFALVAARFNAFVVDHLIGGALDGFARHGVTAAAIDVVRVPGALEIPLAVQRLAQSGRYQAILALGVVIRGETDHYDIVAHESARGIAAVSLATGIPVINAILTTNNLEQAIHRAGAKSGNKGFEAACVAIEMCNLLPQLPARGDS